MLDTKKEHIAVTEANKLGIPIVAVVDTNCDPDVIQYVIPGNDDAIRSGTLMCRVIADAVEEGRLIASKRSDAAAAVVAHRRGRGPHRRRAGRGPQPGRRGRRRPRGPPGRRPPPASEPAPEASAPAEEPAGTPGAERHRGGGRGRRCPAEAPASTPESPDPAAGTPETTATEAASRGGRAPRQA